MINVDPRLHNLAQCEQLWRAHNVLFAAQFGSTVSGRATTLSDVDIGVWCLSTDNLGARALELTGALMDVVHISRVDLVVLNHASALLQWEVSHTGRVLYEQQADAFRRFQLYALKQREDARPIAAWDQRFVHNRLRAWAHV